MARYTTARVRLVFAALSGACLVGAAAGLSQAAAAQDPQPAPVTATAPSSPEPAAQQPIDNAEPAAVRLPTRPWWTIQIEPAAWYVSPSGDIKLPARSGSGGSSGGGFSDSGDKVDVADLNLDTPRVSPSGELHISADRWRFTLSGAWFGLHRDQTPADENFRIGAATVVSGQTLDVDFEFTTGELTAGYCLWGTDFAGSTPTGHPGRATPLELRTYGFAGARMYRTSLDVHDLDTGESADADEFFVEPIIGARAELDINEVFSIDLQLSGGYFSDSDQSVASLDISVGFFYTPHPNVALQLGWRQLAFDLSDGEGLDEFEYSGRLAGLYAGVTLRF